MRSALKELMVLGGKQPHEQNECNVSTVLEGCPELWERRGGGGGLRTSADNFYGN